LEAIPDDLPGRWWVAHTKPRQEKALERDLRALGVFCYLPLCRHATHSRNTGRASHSLVPLFTGYLFFNGAHDERYLALRTNRIANILDVVHQAELVGQLRQIQRVVLSGISFRRSVRLKVGDWARVVAGPLAGAEGVVCRHRSRLRLALNVRMLGQAVIVEVQQDMLERIDAPAFGIAVV
jgi:transcription antitermination factor NusG